MDIPDDDVAFVNMSIVQFLPFLAFSLLKRQKQKKKRHVYLLMVTLRLFYASVNLTIFNFFHLLH
jgi:hypothetical protein